MYFCFLFFAGLLWADFPRSNIKNPLRHSAVVKAIEQARPAVVSITTETVDQNPFAMVYGGGVSSSDGSGVVISSKGLILTNAHVVAQAQKISVSFADKKQYLAEIVGLSSALDLAVLRIEGKKSFPSIPIGYSSNLMLGEEVIAIGNPFGLGHTVTTGVISALSRSIQTENRVYQDFVQTDASINPGNSGGPLINLSGELIGINTAIRADAEGIGFAIPIDRAIKVAQDLKTYGDVQRPWLGVSLVDVRIRTDPGTAPRVERVYTPSSPLQDGDIVLSLLGQSVRSAADVNAKLGVLSENDALTLTIWREGKEITRTLPPQRYDKKKQIQDFFKRIGCTLQKNSTRIESVVARRVLAKNRIRSGDRIFAINGVYVQTQKELHVAIAKAQKDHFGSILIGVQRGRIRGQIEVPL